MTKTTTINKTKELLGQVNLALRDLSNMLSVIILILIVTTIQLIMLLGYTFDKNKKELIEKTLKRIHNTSNTIVKKIA